MTTAQAAALYELQHLAEWGAKGYALHNPNNLPVEDLPVIYGFNNGGGGGMWHAVLIAQDGTPLGGHACSSEGYMRHDLGIVEGARPDRHEGFQKHYPDGYRMDFVGYDEVSEHAGLQAAFAAHEAKYKDVEAPRPSP